MEKIFKHITSTNAANDGSLLQRLYSKVYPYINQILGIICTLIITKRLVFQNKILL